MDDTLLISQRSEHVLSNEIGNYFYIKEGYVGPPTVYIGNRFYKVTLNNGVDA